MSGWEKAREEGNKEGQKEGSIVFVPPALILFLPPTSSFAMTFTGTPLTAYAVGKLNISPAQLNITGTMLALPWSFKVLYGLLSDCVPIRGKRRKPYFIIGWSIFVGE